MSWLKVFDHFNTQLSALGFKEWEKPFEQDNIPSTIIDQVFYQELVGITGSNQSNQDVTTTVTQRLEIYFRGFRDTESALKEALVRAEEVVLKCLDYTAVSAPLVKVGFQDLELVPLDQAENDRVVLARITFDVQVNLCLS